MSHSRVGCIIRDLAREAGHSVDLDYLKALKEGLSLYNPV